MYTSYLLPLCTHPHLPCTYPHFLMYTHPHFHMHTYIFSCIHPPTLSCVLTNIFSGTHQYFLIYSPTFWHCVPVKPSWQVQEKAFCRLAHWPFTQGELSHSLISVRKCESLHYSICIAISWCHFLLNLRHELISYNELETLDKTIVRKSRQIVKNFKCCFTWIL